MTLTTQNIPTADKLALLKETTGERVLPKYREGYADPELYIYCSHSTASGDRKTIIFSMQFGLTLEQYQESIVRQFGHLYPDLRIEHASQWWATKEYAEKLKRENVN
ncbi:MAG: hypothetical protein Kapaf2KO_23770 [Candidatus Kapaibacteriales bacterium]